MLEEFGLTHAEEKVYLILLRNGLVPASFLVKKSQLHRTTVYDILDRLIEKGFASHIIQNKVRYYSAVKSHKLLDIALEETKKAEEKQKLARELIRKIESIEKEKESKSIARIFAGNKGLRTVMNDIIETGKDFIVFGAEGKFEDCSGMSSYTEQWAQKRWKNKIKARIICTENSPVSKWKLNKIRFVGKEYQSPATTIIFGEKTAIFIHEEPILIILIESKKLAQSYRNYFELLWKTAGD